MSTDHMLGDMAESAYDQAAVPGVVKWFDAETGWGVLAAPEVPGDCFVHFANIEMDGFRALEPGQRVRFTFEQPGQDGCAYRAITVWP